MYELLDLNLLCLLSQNRLSDFHAELELLPSSTAILNLRYKFLSLVEVNITNL